MSCALPSAHVVLVADLDGLLARLVVVIVLLRRDDYAVLLVLVEAMESDHLLATLERDGLACLEVFVLAAAWRHNVIEVHKEGPRLNLIASLLVVLEEVHVFLRHDVIAVFTFVHDQIVVLPQSLENVGEGRFLAL